MTARALLPVAFAGLVVLTGCGRQSMAPVKGRVTCNGQPVREAATTFSPIPKTEDDKYPGKPAAGFTDADGMYELSTYKPLDGALVGRHRVTVALDDTNPARCTRQKDLELEVKPSGNELNIELDPR
jgi:hypothetical protein